MVNSTHYSITESNSLTPSIYMCNDFLTVLEALPPPTEVLHSHSDLLSPKALHLAKMQSKWLLGPLS